MMPAGDVPKKAMNAGSAADLVLAVITSTFEPIVRKEVDRIVRQAEADAKIRIAQEINRLAQDLSIRMAVFVNHLKSRGITVDVTVHMPGIIDANSDSPGLQGK